MSTHKVCLWRNKTNMSGYSSYLGHVSRPACSFAVFVHVCFFLLEGIQRAMLLVKCPY